MEKTRTKSEHLKSDLGLRNVHHANHFGRKYESFWNKGPMKIMWHWKGEAVDRSKGFYSDLNVDLEKVVTKLWTSSVSLSCGFLNAIKEALANAQKTLVLYRIAVPQHRVSSGRSQISKRLLLRMQVSSFILMLSFRIWIYVILMIWTNLLLCLEPSFIFRTNRVQPDSPGHEWRKSPTGLVFENYQVSYQQIQFNESRMTKLMWFSWPCCGGYAITEITAC